LRKPPLLLSCNSIKGMARLCNRVVNVLRYFIRKTIERRLRRVEALLRDPTAAQERLLLGLVHRARRTEWGRRHDYARIRSVSDFQRAVPMSRYEDLAPLWHRAFDGARDVTWPGHIKFFSLTSGTTAAHCKVMPVSREAIRANFRSGATLLGVCARRAGDARFFTGKSLYFGGSTRLERHGACRQGDASGISAAHLPRLARRYRLPETDVAALTDWEEKVEAICRRYLDAPVGMVAGLPSWTLLLFRRLVEVARERGRRSVATVAEVWPDLRVFVHFGMAFAPYRRPFEEVMGRHIATVDTYSSSEGGLNAIQTEPDDPGMQLEVDTGAFFEFVPADELDRPDPPRLTLDQVETDVDYAVLLSTPSGIWAYDVGDVVRFTSLRPPKLIVAGRTRLSLNTFGEHVIQEDLEHALVEACRALDARVSDFTVASVPPTAAEPRGRHVWLVEFEPPAPPLEAFAEKLDAAVAAQSLDYQIHRKRDYGMRGPQVLSLAPGTFYEWARRHGALGGQHKVPRVARDSAMVDELQALSKRLAAPPSR